MSVCVRPLATHRPASRRTGPSRRVSSSQPAVAALGWTGRSRTREATDSGLLCLVPGMTHRTRVSDMRMSLAVSIDGPLRRLATAIRPSPQRGLRVPRSAEAPR